MVNFKQLSQATILLSMVLLLLPGCQLTIADDKNDTSIADDENDTSYGEYYLSLQQLSEQQLTEEVCKQQAYVESQTSLAQQNDYDPQIKLLLLYSLPKSPVYNSFNAKALLNQMKTEGNNAAFADITPSEQALITLLRDQLNQRLLMRNRLMAQQQEQLEQLEEQKNNAIKQQQELITQVQLLEQTIKQLKNIEQAIDERDQ